MGLFKRPDSPYWWMAFDKDPATGKEPRPRTSTKILWDAPTPGQRAANKRDAEAMWHDALVEIRKGVHLVKEKPPITFGEYADWWLKTVASTHKAAKNNKAAATTVSSIGILVAEFGPLPLRDLTPNRAIEFRHKRVHGIPLLHDLPNLDRGAVSARTADRDVENLGIMLNRAVPDYLDAHPLRNPATGRRYIKRLRWKEFEARFFTRDEFAAFIAAIEESDEILGTRREEGLALAYTAIQTMLRLGSLMALTWAKYREDHFVPLDAKVSIKWSPVTTKMRTYLDQLPHTSEFVFQSHHISTNEGAAENHAIRWFAEVCARAHIDCGRDRQGVTFHSFRHTGASWMIEAGVDVKTVMELGGWHNAEIFMATYCHTTKARKMVAAETVLDRPAEPATVTSIEGGRKKK